jgi:tetratricopeptide (TPR) repeat protein
MLKVACLLLATAIVFVLSMASYAQRAADPTDRRNPVMTADRIDANKDTLFSLFSENRKSPGAAQQRRAYEAAKEFVRRFGTDNDVYSKETKKFVNEYEKGALEYQLVNAFNAKNYAKSFEVGRAALKINPDSFYVLGVLAETGYENALSGNMSLNEETVGYIRRAIELIEGGKVTDPEPFKGMEAADGVLNLELGWFIRDKAPAEAATAFTKAVQAKSPYEHDPLTFYRLAVALLKGPLSQASVEYNDKFGGKRASAEQQADFDKLNHLATRSIDAFARSIALSDPQLPSASTAPSQFTPEFRAKVMTQLTELYKSFHNGSDAGLAELIAGVLAKPLP